MSENKGKALKSGIWYTISNFLVKGIAFLSTPIFARIMTKADIGDYSNFTSWLSILVVIFSGELYTSVSVARFDYKDELDDFIASNLLLGTIISAVFSILILLLKPWVTQIFGFGTLEISLLIAYCMVFPATQMFQVKRRILYKYKSVIGLSLISSLLPMGLSIVAVRLIENSFSARLLGFYAPLILINVVLYIYLISRAQKIKIEYWKYALTISLPLVIHVLSNNLLNSCDRVMIKKISGNEMLANYSVAYTCAMVVNLLWVSINSAWSPWAFEQMNDKNFSELKNGAKYILIGYGVLVATIMLLAPEILWLVGDKAYLEAIQVIPPVMVGYAIQAIYTFYVNIETFSKKQKNIAINTLVAAIINIVLNWIFIPKFGYIAAAYTSLIGYFVLLIMHYMQVKRMDKSKWYSTGFNCGFVLFFLVYLGICCLLYEFNIVRYIAIGALFLAILVFMVKERNVLILVVKKKSIKPIITRFSKKK